MAPANQHSKRDQILDAAVELFATQGYAATSVADIQTACGLTAGSGALYKHFRSKEDLLREVIARHVAGIAADRAQAAADIPEDLETALRAGAELVWQSMDRDRNVIRITLRDLDAFPDLVDKLWRGFLGDMYGAVTALLETEREQGRIEVDDPAATAAVLLASLTYFPILEGLIARTPGGIDRTRYLGAWVDSARRTISPSSPATRTRRGSGALATMPSDRTRQRPSSKYPRDKPETN